MTLQSTMLAVPVSDTTEDDETVPVAKWEHEELSKIKIRVYRGHKEGVNRCIFSGANDESFVTCSDDTTVRIWSVEKGEQIGILKGHTMEIPSVSVWKDTSRVLSCSYDKTVKFWDTETGRNLWTAKSDDLLTCCNLSANERLAVSGSDLNRKLKIWDTTNGVCVMTAEDVHEDTLSSCMFTTSNDKIISTSFDMTTRFWDMKARRTTVTLRGHTNAVSFCDSTFNERLVASVSWDKNICLWDVATGTYRSTGPVVISNAHEGSISSCRFSKDGTILASAGYDRTVSIWDSEDRVLKVILQGHDGWVTDVDISQNKKQLITSSSDKTIRFWEVDDIDNIPMYKAAQKSLGHKVQKCKKCGRPYTVDQTEESEKRSQCVFCRLQARKDAPKLTFDIE